MNLSLSELMTHLLTEKSFFARIANGLQRIEAPGLKTLAVGIRGGRVVFFYDPEFIQRCSMGFGLFALEHEMIHIVMDHIPRYLELLANFTDPEDRKRADSIYNIAMDCADNSLIRGSKHFDIALKETVEMVQWKHPDYEAKEGDGMVLPERHGLPVEGSFEYYQFELMKRTSPDSNSEEGMNLNSLMRQILREMQYEVGDSHSHWNDIEEGQGFDVKTALPDELKGLAEQLRTQLKQVLKNAIREQTQSRGTIPGDIAEHLAEYLANPIVPWWELLCSRVVASKLAKSDRSISRPNRMLMALAEEDPNVIAAVGKVRDPKFHVFFYVDTSGSMSSESLQIARSELWHLLRADEDMTVRYMQGDAQTHFDEVFKCGDDLPDEVHGRGGTDFDEYFRHMAQYVGNDETSPDIVNIYTDRYAPAVQPLNRLPPEVPVIWLLTPEHSSEQLQGYGEVLVCDPTHNKLHDKD